MQPTGIPLGAAKANQKVGCPSAKARSAASELLDIGVWVVFINTIEEANVFFFVSHLVFRAHIGSPTKFELHTARFIRG